jgi:hypothetical protein
MTWRFPGLVWWFWPALVIVLPAAIWAAHTSNRRDFVHKCVGTLANSDDFAAVKAKTEKCVALWEVRVE